MRSYLWHHPYVSFLAALLIGAAIALLLVPRLIAAQRTRAIGQRVYEDAPSRHAAKEGTPTLGGLAFLAALLAGWLVGAILSPPVWVSPALLWPTLKIDLPEICLVLAVGLIGITDDLLILKRKRPLGLRARWKFALLAIVALAYVLWIAYPCCRGAYDAAWFGNVIHLPPWLWAGLSIAAIVGAANAVNLTDGLDGLAAGAVIPPLLFLSYLVWHAFGAAVAGACLGFLWFNKHPARIFMGDVGSLSLGALLAALAIPHGMILLLPIIGFVFVAEALSVVAQVISFQTTGRRIFKMSPLHHHFELSGWREKTVTATFVSTSLVISLATWLGFNYSYYVRGLAH